MCTLPTQLISSALESVDITRARSSTARAGSIQGMSPEHYCSFSVASVHLPNVCDVCVSFPKICLHLSTSNGREVHNKLHASIGPLWELIIQMWTMPQNCVKLPCSSKRSRAGLQLHIHMLWATKITDGQQSFIGNALLYFRRILRIAQRENTVSNKHIALM